MRRAFCSLLFLMSIELASSAGNFPGLAELRAMAARFVPTPLEADLTSLSAGDRRALGKLVQAARVVDDLFIEQLWSGNEKLYRKLASEQTPLGRARFHLYWLNKGPWSELDQHRAFLAGVPAHKPLGANFYPEDMTKQEFETWVHTLSEPQQDAARSFFILIRRDLKTRKLTIVPYSQEYRPHLQRASQLLREAAAETDNASLKRFLELRAAAFLDNDYFASDVAWMDLDAPIDITIGPYETYNDELFGYKAAFEAYVCLKDEAETQKVRRFSAHLQEVENNLPIDPKYRNPKLGSTTPIRVVNEVLAAGDGNHGVQTAAYNLPNDERVVQQKGSKKVMLKNVQHAKFDRILLPISDAALTPEARKAVDFEWFFTHILAHEIAHGIGPHEITKAGRRTSVRLELKELYSTVEEAKADITGLYMLQFFLDRGMLSGGANVERRIYTTYLASAFRTLRFGISEAHGRGMALQLNYLLDHDAFTHRPGGRFEVNYSAVKGAVRRLTSELLTLEARGDYEAAKQMLDRLGLIRPEVREMLNQMTHIPVDIEPRFATADALFPPPHPIVP